MSAQIETTEWMVYFATCKLCDYEDGPHLERLNAVQAKDLHDWQFHDESAEQGEGSTDGE